MESMFPVFIVLKVGMIRERIASQTSVFPCRRDLSGKECERQTDALLTFSLGSNLSPILKSHRETNDKKWRSTTSTIRQS